MLDSAHRYAQARRLHQQTNRMLERENATASVSHSKLREQAAALTQPAALTRPAKVMVAVSAWVAVTFFISYLTLPLLRAVLGMVDAIDAFIVSLCGLGGLVLMLPLLWAGIALRRTTLSAQVTPEHALAATAGSLLMWGLLHNTLPGVLPFDEMGTMELAAVLGSNILESAMFGVMLAALSVTGRGAFSLGMTFQTAFFSASYLILLSLL